ncbi:hypothetical protein CLIM01_06064 [Colletotrichum limetticola]|uniref:Uncharacterized protein n=1 Tax=Colletotrichum limetticola TaxID=1209924 RepID=A0ABQ9PYH6_9PEZI|nr:hypothetical protein CLIM01_06064 [Colletotrichum limetticola]
MSLSHAGDVPPPPPRPPVEKARTPPPAPPPPTVPATGSPGAFLVELLIYNGSPFKDHWAYFVRSRADDDIGVKIHATGDVRNGSKFEVKRSHDLTNTSDIPTKRVPLQWVDAQHLDEDAMLNWGVEEIDSRPVRAFEACAYKAKAPGKTLNAAEDNSFKDTLGKKVTLKDCQTWLVDAADCLVEDRMFSSEVAVYLHAITQ